MSKMNLPKFTAEQSLYGKVVQPQLRKTDYECVHDCLEAGGGDICNFFCILRPCLNLCCCILFI